MLDDGLAFIRPAQCTVGMSDMEFGPDSDFVLVRTDRSSPRIGVVRFRRRIKGGQLEQLRQNPNQFHLVGDPKF
jgi:hypothetical protein